LLNITVECIKKDVILKKFKMKEVMLYMDIPINHFEVIITVQ